MVGRVRSLVSSLTRLEVAAFVTGVVVRVLTAVGFRPEWGFDFPFHLGYVQWVAAHWTRPDINLNAAAYHSPLYYFLAAPWVRLGAGPRVVQQISVVCGCVRLAILWVGLRRFLPLHPWARALALLLAAILPAAVQLDGHVSNEALGTTLAAVAILALPSVSGERPRPRDVLWFCFWLGLAVVTKVSYLLVGWVALPFGARSVWRAVRRDRSWPGWRAWRAVTPWLAGAALFTVVTAPLFVVNLYRYGHLVVTGYDGPLKKWQLPREKIPYFDRRTVGFYVAWDARIWGDPYYPTACCASSRFFPVLTAAAFGDYLNYGFGLPVPPDGMASAVRRNNRPVAPATMWLSRISVVAGSLLALVLAVTTVVVARRLWRGGARDPRLVLVLLPVLGVLGQLHFATRYATDQDGPIKGTYIQFAMLPAFAMVGLAFEVLARDPVRRRRTLAALIALAVAAVAVYTLVMKVGAIVLGG